MKKNNKTKRIYCIHVFALFINNCINIARSFNINAIKLEFNTTTTSPIRSSIPTLRLSSLPNASIHFSRKIVEHKKRRKCTTYNSNSGKVDFPPSLSRPFVRLREMLWMSLSLNGSGWVLGRVDWDVEMLHDD
jgi:hypothetical protein